MAGAEAGMQFADNGAEVLLIEPPSGHAMRGSPGFLVWGRGKKSVVLDLKTAEGVAKLKELARDADCFINDFQPGQAEKMGFGYEALSKINPRLAYAAITGFGETGPFRDLPGYEYVVQAKTGRMNSQEGFRKGPIFTPTPIATYGAAMLAVQGLLAALQARKHTGKGQRVHTSLLHALTTFDMGGFMHMMVKQDLADSGAVRGVLALAFMTPKCADGRYLQMCSRMPHLFRNWMRALDLEALYEDPAYQYMPDVVGSAAEMAGLLDMIEVKMLEKTSEQWLEIFSKNDIGGDPFLQAKEFLHHPQPVACGRAVEIVDPKVGKMRQIGPLAQFSKTPSVIVRPAPAAGQHTKEVLAAIKPAAHGAAVKAPAKTGRALRYPLDGITCLEVAYFYAAPFSMTLLAEMGARIIKIEPPQGDPMRRNWSSVYSKSAQGKESVILDLKHPESVEIVHRIAEKADVFLTNFRPGVPAKLKIDYDTLIKINPKLVYLYGGCFGSKGPWSHRPGFHSTPNAMAGSGFVESGRGNPPRDRTFPDPVGALSAATAAMMGLQARERTGQGQYIETTMISSLGHTMARWSLDYAGKPEDPINDQGQHGLHALTRLYPVKDGTWLFLMTCLEKQWQALAKAIEVPELLTDKRFADAGARAKNDAALIERLQTALASRTAGEWEQRLTKAGVPAVRADEYQHHDFMLNHPQIRLNGLAVEDSLPDKGKFWRSSSCVQFSDMPTRYAHPEATGSYTEQVLREFGVSERQLEELHRKGTTVAVGHGLPV